MRARREPQSWSLPVRELFACRAERQAARSVPLGVRVVHSSHRPQWAPMGSEGKGQEAPRDRKSTRLNSSHVKISYAVFCLKKKRRHAKMATNVSITGCTR